MIPVKRINTVADLEQFHSSVAFQRIKLLIDTYSQSVIGLSVPDAAKSDLTIKLLNDFQTLSSLIDDTPPVTTPQRFGNPSYREWQSKMRAAELESAPSEEMLYYLHESFGSTQRIDYGTGHELNFLAFVGGWSAQVNEQLKGADILLIFKQYTHLCRKLITTYNLEPAGSKGIWGLDDHFHMSYILGAAQLASNGPNEPPLPKDILNIQAVAEYKSSNLYFDAVDYINSVKKGAFFEHSPILYDVSGVRSWAKIKSGMIKMYMGEILHKFPVVQHFYFGETYPFSPP